MGFLVAYDGQMVEFERHKIHGGLKGECGIIALPVSNKQKLYEELINALKI